MIIRDPVERNEAWQEDLLGLCFRCQEPYASAAEFRQVYFKAPNELVEYELLAA
jgi:hypothetical protein